MVLAASYLNPIKGTPQMANQEIQTAQQASESDMRAIQNMFERAANAIVNSSNLGKEVEALRVQVNELVADTQRLREHISWLEQENVTLRTQRDEAQNALSDARRDIDAYVNEAARLNNNLTIAYGERDNARGEAKLWQEEAGALEKERNGLKAEVTYFEGLLNNVWGSIKDHFTEPQAPNAEPTPVTQSTDPNAPHYVHQPRDEYGRWVDQGGNAHDQDQGGGKGEHITEHQHF